MDTGTILYLLLIFAFWLLSGRKKKKKKRQIPGTGLPQPEARRRNPTPFEEILRQMQEALEAPQAPPPPAPKPVPAPVHTHQNEDMFEADPVFKGDHFRTAETQTFDEPFERKPLRQEFHKPTAKPLSGPIIRVPKTKQAKQEHALGSFNLRKMNQNDLQRAFVLHEIFGSRGGHRPIKP